MKPDAPAGFAASSIRFKQTSTASRSASICRAARQQDKFSLVRSFRHHNSDHGPADHYILTGYFPQAGFNPSLTPNNQRPALGSVIARKQGRARRASLRVFAAHAPKQRLGISGTTVSPFVIDADGNAPNFSVPDIAAAVDATNRLENRRELLRQLDRVQESAERQANTHARAVGDYQREAFNLMVSPEARRAFDLQAEPARLRDEYGRHTLGQSCLMARRLVEAGVRCVTIDHSNWDTHDNNFLTLRRELLPALDSGLSTLFRDLADRGRLQNTLVVVTGEFGRTPRINRARARPLGPHGRLGGGGVQAAVSGAPDAAPMAPNNPHGPGIWRRLSSLGIDVTEEFFTPEGRPVPIVSNGRAIRELL